MNIIELEMNVPLETACAEWDAIPETDRAKKAAYWERYRQIRTGTADPAKPVTYKGAPGILAKLKPAAPATRVEMIRRIAERGESAPVRPLAPMPKQKPEKEVKSCSTHASVTAGAHSEPPARSVPTRIPTVESNAGASSHPTPPANRRSREGKGRVAKIPAALAGAIHKRINQLAMELGYGDVGGFGVAPIWGGASQFARAIGVTSSSTYHDTVHTGKKVWPKVIDGIVQCLGVSREWLIHGTGDIYTDPSRAIRFAPRATKAPPRKPSRFAEPPPGHPEKAIAAPDALTQPLIKRPPGGALFDPIAFNVDQTFSVVGIKAFVSRYAA